MKGITLQNNIGKLPDASLIKTHAPEVKDKSFGEMLTGSIAEINQLKVEADHAANELIAGEKKDIHQTMIAMEKASISFQLIMQVRNKVIAAYQEIARMQV